MISRAMLPTYRLKSVCPIRIQIAAGFIHRVGRWMGPFPIVLLCDFIAIMIAIAR